MEQEHFFNELDRMFQTGNIKQAENFIIEAMDKVRRDHDLPALLSVANELGGIFRVTNRLEEAKKIYAVALEAIRLLGLENSEQHGTTLLNLASVYTEAGEASEALNLYRKTAAIFSEIGLQQDYRMAALYNNISHACDVLGNLDEALDYARLALDIIKNLKGFDVELATTYTTLAIRYQRKGHFEEALQLLGEAERIFLSLPGRQNVHFAATLNALGDLYYRQGKKEEAAACFEQALAIIKENYGENKSYIEVAKNLARARTNAGRTGNVPVSIDMRMSGMGLAEAYFNEYGKRMIREQFPEYEQYIAAGLVGEGSECFGFDDELSESHDFGPGFCIWLPDDLYSRIGAEMQEAYDDLPKTFRNKFRTETLEGSGRVGVFSIGGFYKKYIGCTGLPKNNVEWLFSPETSLATATNGKVFEDQLGAFSKIRNGLLNFYPRDIYLKKLASRMAMMSQTGQYNYERCMRRGEYAAAYLSCGEFVKTAVSAVYLLNGSYMPFYKWMFRGMDRLNKLHEIKPMLGRLAAMPDVPENTATKVELIEKTCIAIRDELKNQKLITGTDAFLNGHCREVMDLINDPQIRNLPVMFDGK